MKKIFCFLLSILLCLWLTGCTVSSPVSSFQAICHTLVDLGNVTRHIDTHGGFHGDGIEYTCVSYNAQTKRKIKTMLSNDARFSPLPMENTLLESCESSIYEETIPLPSSCAQSGQYAYLDRSPKDDDLATSYVLNFTLIIYNDATNTLHVWRADS